LKKSEKMVDRIEIPVSKTKMFLLVIICLIFIITSFGLLFTDIDIVKKVILSICGVFFIVGFILLAKALIFDSNRTIVIDESGITDNVTKPYAGLIEWKDITHAEIGKIYSNKMLLIYVSEPEKYLSRVTAKGLRNNYNETGTPFVIPSSMLKIKLSELEKIINQRIARHNGQ
jgi:hypothetical protein